MSSQLSFDIQVEIIKRLPVKSLIQFRSVCKAWKSLIDSSHFIAGYNFRHNNQSEHLLVRYDVGDEEKREVKYVSFVDDDSFPQQKFALTVPPLVQETEIVIGSSHGLLCLTDDYYPTSRTSMAVLWNPTIRKSIAVTVPPNVVHHLFDFVLGFGVCLDTKDPKLVKITYISDHRKMESISCIPCQVMVFTLSSGEWKTSCSNVPRKLIGFTWSSAVVGQFIYWLACDWNVVDGEFRNLIMSFDLSTEEFREIEIPDNFHGSCLSISRVRESLVLLDDRETTNEQVCDVWMMEHGHDDSKAFTKQFTINAPHASVLFTLGFKKSGEPVIEMQYEDEDEDEDFYSQCSLFVYEPCLEHIKDLGIRGNECSFYGGSYTESLLLLDHEDGHITKCGAVKT